jgi:hypothetical protein
LNFKTVIARKLQKNLQIFHFLFKKRLHFAKFSAIMKINKQYSGDCAAKPLRKGVKPLRKIEPKRATRALRFLFSRAPNTGKAAAVLDNFRKTIRFLGVGKPIFLRYPRRPC